MIPRKKWATYTAHEKELMKTAVTHASPDEYFTPEYAAAFIGVSPRTLQSWRDNDSDKLEYSKPCRSVVLYQARVLHGFLRRMTYKCTANYRKAS